MPLGGLRAEAFLAAGDKLTGERDLRHQHQRLAATLETLGDGLEIDFRLAGAGDAVEQGHGEAVARVLQELFRGLRLLGVEGGAFARGVERQGMPIGQRLRDQGAGIDQPVDHVRADAGGFRQIGLHPDQAGLRRFEDAGAGRRHSLGRRPFEADAVARRRRLKGRGRAHHHPEHHAEGGERVARDPVGEIHGDRRQLRHVMEDIDDLAQLLPRDLGRLFTLRAPPHGGDVLDRPERHHHERARLGALALGHEIVVRRRQRERHQDGNRHGHGLGHGLGARLRRLGAGGRLGQGALFEVNWDLTTHRPIVA